MQFPRAREDDHREPVQISGSGPVGLVVAAVYDRQLLIQ